MDPREHRQLGEQMLRAGMAPRRVRRMLRELDAHQQDLYEAALSAGLSPEAAALQAERDLGNPGDIVAAALARPELRTMASRCPWAIFALLPSLVLIAGVAAAVLLSLIGISTADSMPIWFPKLIDPLFGFVSHGLPPLLAAAVLVVASRRRAVLLWPTLGVLSVIGIGAALSISIQWPTAAGGDGLLAVSYRYGMGEAIFALLMLLGCLGSYFLLDRWYAPLRAPNCRGGERLR